jgi:hypothetical protein
MKVEKGRENMTRRVVETKGRTMDRESLTNIHIYEEGVGKSEIKQDNPYSKKHGVLVLSANRYELKGLIGS